MGDAHGAARRHPVRRGLGDQLRRRRVLVAARSLAVRGARGGAAAVRHGRRVPPRVLPEAGRGALRRPDDRSLLGTRPDQRPGVALQADPEGRPPRAPRDRGDARQPCADRQPLRAAAWVVPDRVLPLPSPLGGPDRAQGGAPGRRHSRSTSRDPRPRTTRTCTRRSGAAGSASTTRRSSSPTRRSNAASPRAGSSSTLRLRDALRAIAAGREARVPAPDARRRRGVRGRGGGARRGRRRPAPASARRAGAEAPDGRAATAAARVPEARRTAHRVLGDRAASP